MNCERCGKATAVIHITSVVNGTAQSAHLCHECASSEIIMPMPLAPGIVADALAEMKRVMHEANSQTCPQCGVTFGEFQVTGKLGCPEDYDTIPALAGLVHTAQRGVERHVGKVPLKATDETRAAVFAARSARLQHELEIAVFREDYELAANIRDRIRSLLA